MTVNKYATAAGKKYETDLMKYMREQGFDVERLRLTGAEDEGDLVIKHDSSWELRFIAEAKRRKSMDLGGWIKEAEIERDHYEAHRGLGRGTYGFVVIHYARGKGLGGSYVTTTLDEWLTRL